MAFTYSKLAQVTVGAGGAATIDFNNIPQNYTDLTILGSLRGAATSDFPAVVMQFNGSNTAYSGRGILGSGSAVSSFTEGSTFARIGNVPGSVQTASTFGNFLVYIPNYTSSSSKSISIDSVSESNTTAAFSNFMANLWSNTSAITSISMQVQAGVSNLAQHSSATLYGIRVEL